MAAEPYLSERNDSHSEDPLLGFNFMLELEGSLAGYFTECGGIGSEHDVTEHKVVDKQGHEITRKIPGRLKWTDITLKRGITSEMDIWAWRDKVVKGDLKGARKNCTITMMNRDYKPVAIWHFTNAWPSKCTGPNLKSDGNDIGIEEVVLVHEGMYREL
ncbi:MAG: phage tail protein [Anaerolineae bacterium]|nr:phage tail protein [Anaerolineae bacterium]MCB9107677.1 phage tail protein [Anaerolineales bacterium]